MQQVDEVVKQLCAHRRDVVVFSDDAVGKVFVRLAFVRVGDTVMSVSNIFAQKIGGQPHLFVSLDTAVSFVTGS